MRELHVTEGFPTLPKVDLLLYKSKAATSKAAHALHDYLAHYLSLGEETPALIESPVLASALTG